MMNAAASVAPRMMNLQMLMLFRMSASPTTTLRRQRHPSRPLAMTATYKGSRA
jgi:hypothetical protein